MDLNSISNVSSTDDLTQVHYADYEYTEMILGILLGVVAGVSRWYAQSIPNYAVVADGQDVVGAAHMVLEV